MVKLLKNYTMPIVRGLTVAAAVAIQVLFIVAIVHFLEQYAAWLYLGMQIASFFLACALVNDQESYRQFWVIFILLVPVIGLALYFIWGWRHINLTLRRKVDTVKQTLYACLQEDTAIYERIEADHPGKVQINRFLSSEGFPIYANTSVQYFSEGKAMLSSITEDLRAARESIFIEMFIVREGQIWDEIKQILIEKAGQGVNVRLLLDDFGCIGINTRRFRRELREAGIRVRMFAPITHDITRLSFNYRNHQKVIVIDHNIAYTGGINFADEYANLISRFGYWKDSGIRMQGEGVWGMVRIFFEMWALASRKEETIDYRAYLPDPAPDADGYVQPFGDGPFNNPENPAEELYSHMINKARKHLLITTPYLILEQKMTEDLCRAARSGVEVHIVVPHIYDKWYIYMVNVANYGKLIKSGVHLHEFLPGFIHSKTIVCDDECAVCGTINMDFRSFYLHYECGVLLYGSEAVREIREDIAAAISESEEIRYDTWLGRPWYYKLIQWILKLFSSLF